MSAFKNSSEVKNRNLQKIVHKIETLEYDENKRYYENAKNSDLYDDLDDDLNFTDDFYFLTTCVFDRLEIQDAKKFAQLLIDTIPVGLDFTFFRIKMAEWLLLDPRFWKFKQHLNRDQLSDVTRILFNYKKLAAGTCVKSDWHPLLDRAGSSLWFFVEFGYAQTNFPSQQKKAEAEVTNTIYKYFDSLENNYRKTYLDLLNNRELENADYIEYQLFLIGDYRDLLLRRRKELDFCDFNLDDFLKECFRWVSDYNDTMFSGQVPRRKENSDQVPAYEEDLEEPDDGLYTDDVVQAEIDELYFTGNSYPTNEPEPDKFEDRTDYDALDSSIYNREYWASKLLADKIIEILTELANKGTS